MKKKILIAFAGVLAVAAVMSGCGKNEKQNTGSSAGAETDVQITAEELLKATDYDVKDYVTLNDYFGMEIVLPTSYEASEENISAYANQMLVSYPEYEAGDKEIVEENDVVNIDYVGKKDGEAFDGGTAEGYRLKIGSNTFIDGFEDGLIGKKVGETVDLNLTFPENYGNTDLAGQEVVFTVTINSIDEEKPVTYEDLTDEYIASNFAASGITTVDSFKEQLKAIIEQNAQTAIQSEVLNALTTQCKVELPEGLKDERMTTYMEQVKADIEEQGQTFEEAVGMTEEEYRQQISDSLEESLIQELILEAIVQNENISISENEYKNFIQMYMSSYGIADEAAFYEQYGDEAYVKLSYAENQVLTQIMDKVKVTYSDDSSTSAQ